MRNEASGGEIWVKSQLQWNEKYLATDGTVFRLRHCAAWLKGKVQQRGFQFQISWKIWGKWGRTVASQWIFSFDFFENPERKYTWWHFSLDSQVVIVLLSRCSFSISQRRFPTSESLRIEAIRQTPPSLKILLSSLQEDFQGGRLQGWSFILVLDPLERSFCLIWNGSKGNHWYHPLPAWVLMSQVLLVQPRTEDGQGGRVLHLSQLLKRQKGDFSVEFSFFSESGF